jgi:putative ABC transport system substrate-binding protein
MVGRQFGGAPAGPVPAHLPARPEVFGVQKGCDAEVGRAFAAAEQNRPDALIFLASPNFGTNPRLIADLALAHRFASASLFVDIARAGGLMAYGPDLLGTFRQPGPPKVLQGAKAADLPVERPTKFEMVINLKTAKALGLSLPPLLVQRADEVIE